MISEEAVEAASDLIVQGDMGDCECRRSPFDKHDVNPPCSTRRRAIRVARSALEAAAPHMLAEAYEDAADHIIAPGASSAAAAWLRKRAALIRSTTPYRSQP